MMAGFELAGDWSYTGGFDGLTETLVISDATITDVGDLNGTAWTIEYDISSSDNDADQALLVVASTEGFSHYAVGEEIYMSWQLDQNVAKLYFAGGDYPIPSGGAESAAFYTYTRE